MWLKGRLYLIIVGMQGSPHGNVLRKSYGYQVNDKLTRSPTNKPFFLNNQHSTNEHSASIATSIKQLEDKLQGLAAKKLSQPESSSQSHPSLQAGKERLPSSPFGHDEHLSEHILRGSCQTALRRFDYNAMRNTAHFNNLPKPPPSLHELTRAPATDLLSHPLTRMVGQEPSNSLVQPGEKKQIENKRSFLGNSPSRSPPKPDPEDIPFQTARTLNKPKSHFFDALQGKSQKIGTSDPPKAWKTMNDVCEGRKEGPRSSRHSLVVNGFELGRVLGKGKFGEVLLGRHLQTGFVVAVKRIQKAKVRQLKMVDQFVQEIRLHSCLQHPNIAKFFGAFQEGQHVYLLVQYLNGGTLFDKLNDVTQLPVKQAVDYLSNVIEAVAYLHQKSIAHRDIKPQNIVLSSEGVAKLCDFGWAALVQTTRKTYCGTLDYAPPEVLQRREYDESVDVWCIGVLAFELLAGRAPFEGEQRSVVREKIINVDKQAIMFPADFPPEAKEFVEALVQKDPALRPKCHDLLKFSLFTLHKAKHKKL